MSTFNGAIRLFSGNNSTLKGYYTLLKKYNITKNSDLRNIVTHANVDFYDFLALPIEKKEETIKKGIAVHPIYNNENAIAAFVNNPDKFQYKPARIPVPATYLIDDATFKKYLNLTSTVFKYNDLSKESKEKYKKLRIETNEQLKQFLDPINKSLTYNELSEKSQEKYAIAAKKWIIAQQMRNPVGAAGGHRKRSTQKRARRNRRATARFFVRGK